MRPSSLALIFVLTATCMAETRQWRNHDASSSFEGSYVSHDNSSVTIRRADGSEVKVGLDKLHPEDRAWVNGLALEKTEEDAGSAVFDTLTFGDSRKEVETKLLASKLVEPSVDPTFLGRLGLNHTFRTRQTIGGMKCDLSFGWTEGGSLNEITLQTEARDASSYDDLLHKTWQELASLLTQLHGKALQEGPYPARDQLADGTFLGSHLWRLAGGGTAILGTGGHEGGFQVTVRFTTETIEPVRVP
ncbi:MAG: hypothetical protein MUF31_18925 [Akkermansiaceae bacterium]|nr:hypothetical protein [Akkermansiaceae bacterium]